VKKIKHSMSPPYWQMLTQYIWYNSQEFMSMKVSRDFCHSYLSVGLVCLLHSLSTFTRCVASLPSYSKTTGRISETNWNLETWFILHTLGTIC